MTIAAIWGAVDYSPQAEEPRTGERVKAESPFNSKGYVFEIEYAWEGSRYEPKCRFVTYAEMSPAERKAEFEDNDDDSPSILGALSQLPPFSWAVEWFLPWSAGKIDDFGLLEDCPNAEEIRAELEEYQRSSRAGD